MNSKPLILVTNDDGIDAPGIKVLTELMAEIGEVVVFAPAFPQSGQSNALTVTAPIRFNKVDECENLARYSCTGTPTDCVKLALNEILNGRKPDLLVSGINHGSNSAINVIYSGTMGASLEGCAGGIPSIGFSICDHSWNVDFENFKPFVLKIAKMVLENGLPERVCLNVNAPVGEIKGMKTVRQCKGFWTKEFEKREDPRGVGDYFWLTGCFHNQEPEATDTDECALANGYISIVPTRVDMTDYESLNMQF